LLLVAEPATRHLQALAAGDPGREDKMSTLTQLGLTDEEVIEIAESVATANNISFARALTAPAIDSTGSEAIEIKIVLAPGSSQSSANARREPSPK
jgi:hypothetical protein